jgi:bacillolysin
MNKPKAIIMTITITIIAILSVPTVGFSQKSGPAPTDKITQDSTGQVLIVWNPSQNTASFVSAKVEAETFASPGLHNPSDLALAFINNYAGLFGVKSASEELKVMQPKTDSLGMTEISLQQVYNGVLVYGAVMKVHLASDGQTVVAASSDFIPDVNVANTTPAISVDQALATAQKALPKGKSLSAPQLVVYAGSALEPIKQASLAWVVDLLDNSLPVRNLYFIDAIQGGILGTQNILYDGLNREVYTAYHGTDLPGTLVRAEGSSSSGDTDVDNAYNFTGDTYNYYKTTFNRDSYDNNGATLTSTVHYGNNYQNAFWNGIQMVYGDGFPVNDVTAHELTHAVTERTAGLNYQWQSGALNESFSDIFGAMVDRDDWLMGEDLPTSVLGGREAIRDLSDPTRFGQPANTADWVATCSDNEGVHTNSGITNKAYYNIATAIGKDKAEQIFYRALTVYLSASSSLEDARAAALQSTQDLYTVAGQEYTAVIDGFNAVGLDGSWNPPANNCTCSASVALTDGSVTGNKVNPVDTAMTLYRLRDQLLNTTSTGKYYKGLYEKYTGTISTMLLLNSDLRNTGLKILTDLTPGLSQLVTVSDSDKVVTPEIVTEVKSYLSELAENDRANGNGGLANTIEKEMARIDWNKLTGMTYTEAWNYIQSINEYKYFIFMPSIVSR